MIDQVGAHMPDKYETLLDNYRNARQALRMVRETIETLGPPGALPSEEAVNSLYGPEPVHEAQAIVDALVTILSDPHARRTQLPQ
jgi:hypothetical protein